MQALSVIIPVYQSQDYLSELYRRLVSTLDNQKILFEIVLVDDGSLDNSWQVISEISERDPRVRGIKLNRNFGQHHALLCGILEASNEWILTMDDDLQNPPEEIPKLMAKAREGFDLVYGKFSKTSHPLWRRFASKIVKGFFKKVMGTTLVYDASTFRLFHSRFKEVFSGYKGAFVSLDIILSWATHHYVCVPVQHRFRSQGRSNYNLRRLMAHTFNLLTGSTAFPLKMASLIGFFFTFFGVIVLLYVLIRYFWEGGSTPGFPFLASILAIFSGAQLFALGIIGEYLARIFYRAMDRPLYFIQTTTQSKNPLRLTPGFPENGKKISI